MRALIVDDEPLARQGVALRLRQFPQIEIVGECEDGEQAIEAICEIAPDLVFLDIQMPSMSGFDVLRTLPRERIPAVIFLTAYDQYALQAFDVHALDYVLKPINSQRFCDAVTKALKIMDTGWRPRIGELIDGLPRHYATRFTVQTGTRIHVVRAEEIDWISTARDYVELHVAKRVHLMRETMTSLEQRLDPAKFLRVHRSRIVRTDKIVGLRSIENRGYVITLTDGSEHRSSRTYANQLSRWLRGSS